MSKPGSLQLKWVVSCPLHTSAYALFMNLHSHRVLPPIRPIGSGRICGSVGGFVGLCKRPRKMFSDKLFRIPQSLLGRASYHAAWCITRSRCLFPSLSLSLPVLPPLFLHLSITLSACRFFPSVFACCRVLILQRWASHSLRWTQFLGKLSPIMAAINNTL